MKMNYKKTLKILLKCGLYAFLMSRMFHPILSTTFSGECLTIKSFLDIAVIKLLGFISSISDDKFEKIGTFVLFCNAFFFAYFFAKICGLYKTFKDFKIWQKCLIFQNLIILV